uniref:Uncharacterized protein n=1 Tax=Rhizophora mucronata TaxID=61149 RepID=A0A2P2QFA0_RHIMU
MVEAKEIGNTRSLIPFKVIPTIKRNSL